MSSDQGTTPGAILVGLLLSLPLLVLVPSRLLAAYKRSIAHWMRASAEDGNGNDFQAVPADAAPANLLLPQASTPWLTLAHARRRRCALGYTLAGTSAASALALALLAVSGRHTLVGFFLILTANLWPALLAAGLILGWTRPTWHRAILLYLCALGILGVLRHTFAPEARIANLFLLFLLLNFPATIFFRAVSLRAIRQVAPTLLPFSIAVVLGPWFLLHLGAGHFSIALAIAHLAIVLHLSNLAAIALTVLLTLLAMAVLGRAIASVVAVLYRARHVSDQMLLLDALWLLVCGMQALVFLTITGHESGSGAPWAIAAFPLYLAVLRLGLLAFIPRPASAPSLLVLRAFALEQRAEAVFQPIAGLWRYLGPVRLIGAPDLAATTAEPGIFLDFISGRLGTLFLRSVQQFHNRLAQQSTTPDPDGRFRTDSFFCFNNTWRPAVATLIRRTDVILADFRGLAHAKGRGCEWEIEEIVRAVAVTRCVFLLEPPPNGSSEASPDAIYLHTLLAGAAQASAIPLDLASVQIVHGSDLSGRSFESLLSLLAAPSRPHVTC